MNVNLVCKHVNEVTWMSLSLCSQSHQQSNVDNSAKSQTNNASCPGFCSFIVHFLPHFPDEVPEIDVHMDVDLGLAEYSQLGAVLLGLGQILK